MRNLNIWDVSVKDLRINSQKKLVAAYGHNDNNSTKELYVCTPNLIVCSYHENGTIKWSKDLSYHTIPSDNSPVNITHLLLPCTLCVGFENGELMTISDDGQNCTVNGVCSDGLLAVEWSPDQELLVLVTKTMNAILMSCTFDIIHETNLLSNDFGEKQFITVGWGKKETQFHGSEGKQAAKAKNEVSADLSLAAEDVVKITWRGDGNLYAVGFALEGIRYFKVFDREGHVQYTSEKQPGVEANLSWRPSGSVIATTQKLPEKYVIAFFEKNGLKHGDFTIPVNVTTRVEDLIWSSDSEILAIQCLDTEQNTQKLLLYTSSNYHWYLKQTLVFNSEQRISNIIWDNDFELLNNKKLHILLHNGQHYTYSWIWNVDHSRGKTDTDDAVVSVIDGNELLVTGFRQTVVPPPMAALKITCDAIINSVHFAPHHQDESSFDVNTFFVCTTDNKLVFYEQTKKFPLDYKTQKIVEFNHHQFPFQYYNWFWLSRDTIICVEAGDNSYNLVEWSLNDETIVKKHVQSLAVGILRIQSHPNNVSALFIQLKNGDVLEYLTGGTVTPQDTTFNTPCPKFDVLLVDGELTFIGLNHKGHMFFNNKKVLSNVSSFFVHTHFLLLTTLQHVLLCAKLAKSGLMSISDYNQNSESTNNVYNRNIERGAKLIIAVPNDTRTIFQMPRGNLETIQPRPLSLKIIGEYLDSLKYFEAFDLMRKQRINLNLIYDHDPDKFLNNTDIFIESIQNNSWLCLFLSDLETVDVTDTMYSSSYIEKSNGLKANIGSKIIKICNIIREHLKIRSDGDGKILPLLTTYVKINTDIELESALKLIKKLKVQESSGSKLPVGSDEALRYLLYMVEVNKLFEVALGMYDFDLVLLVANKSQKDPKEYIPMLNELNDMEENYKRYTINKHLKRYGKAVQSLAKCGPDKYSELKTFVKYHSLYKEALALFSQSEDIYREISDDFGLFLKLKKQYTEAGIVYERANNYEKAVNCYKDALEWELALKSAKTWPKDKHDELCMQLIALLKQEKRHTDALIILERYLGNVEETILYSIENCQFKTAIRLCSLYDFNELRDEKLLPAILEEFKNTQELIEKSWDKFVSQKQRLRVVRENKSNHPAETYDASYAHRDSDLYSDAGSTVASSSSRGSSRTYRSSKNRRKHERKLASLKEGSQYEDVALIVDLHKLIVGSFKLRPLVRELNIALCWFNRDRDAFMLQTCLDKLLKEMKDSFKEIWTDELNIEATNACVAAQHMPEGCSVILQGIASLEPHLRIAPLINQMNWKLDGLCS